MAGAAPIRRRAIRAAARALLAAAVLLWAPSARAQHDARRVHADSAAMPDTMPGMSMAHAAPAAPLGIPLSRAGSGTSWLPDAAPMHADHFTAGPWELMLHFSVFAYYDRQNAADTARRGADQVGSVNWGMLMAARTLAGGRLQLRGMFSAEPWTVGARGYPLLLQSGESYRGVPLHDRQHPHDLFMELAAIYDRAVAPDLAVQLYAAPVGEPASGPVAFPHRPSAAADPFAPLSHHWQDATHITFGVLTAAVYGRRWKLEGSVFNGREPDDRRTDFDFRTLDSYAGRLTVNPSAEWSLSGSYAWLRSPEALVPGDAVHRITASVLHSRPLGRTGEWSSALIWGANRHSSDGELSNSVLAETNVALTARDNLFARLEYVNKSAEDLDIATFTLAFQAPAPGQASAMPHFDIGSLAFGYLRDVASVPGGRLGVGGRFSMAVLPGALVPDYGSRTPSGFALFLRLRPGTMAMAMAGPP